jgi:NADH-quinone oxidoreductase subunit J
MAIFFYLFAGLLITGSMGVIISRNPVYSVLWLIFAFCNSAGLFILLGAEFLAMTLIVVYVGAVAVLFLFVVMMLDINIAEIKTSISANWPLVVFFLTLFGAEIIIIIALGLKQTIAVPTLLIPEGVNNTAAIGSLLYTDFMLPFQLSGIILLSAMIGSIVLTLRHLPGVKRQDKNMQLSKTKENALMVHKVKTNMGAKVKYE